MKKLSILLALSFLFSANITFAHHHHGSCSSCVYVVRSDVFQEEQGFKNCEKHTMLVDTTINYYSNGSRRTFYNYTVLNKNKTPLITNCSDIKHVMHNKKHYFLARQGKYYKIINEEGIELTKRKYNKMKEIAPNKILVNVNKKYGIIDINENVIVPIKYQKFEQINSNLFMTKLNGYWGLIDNSNNILLKNEFNKIKPLYDTYHGKNTDKYVLLDVNGNIILDDLEKIKKLGEYIIVKKDKKYGVYDSLGNQLSEIKYKKVKLERNTLKMYEDKKWIDLI